MTKKEIIDKVYDDYLKDYGRVGYKIAAKKPRCLRRG